MRVTIATPSSELSNTRQLMVNIAMVTDSTDDEWRNSFAAKYQDADGNIFNAASFDATDAWIEQLNALSEDVIIWQAPSDGPIPQATDSTLVAVLNMRGPEAISSMGLRPIETEMTDV
jgi:hypothetical protein